MHCSFNVSQVYPGQIGAVTASDIDGDGYGDVVFAVGNSGVYFGQNDRATTGTPQWNTMLVSTVVGTLQGSAPLQLILSTST